ncbi:hypothetical protein Ga0466249_001615 [Sporomusaceae bacterium BoRhaA]|nr:hypothetical protein [Pelorhabdus rhamnosifermentans]
MQKLSLYVADFFIKNIGGGRTESWTMYNGYRKRLVTAQPVSTAGDDPRENLTEVDPASSDEVEKLKSKNRICSLK